MDNNDPSMNFYQDRCHQGRTGMLSDIVQECRRVKRHFFYRQGRSGMLGDIVKECQLMKRHLFARLDQDPQVISNELTLPKCLMTDNNVSLMHYYQDQSRWGHTGLLSDIVEECRFMKKRCFALQYQDPQTLDSSLQQAYVGVPNEQPPSKHIKVEHLCDGKRDSELMIKSSAISASSGNVRDSINDVEVEDLCDGKKDSELMIKSSAISASSGNISDSINDVEVEHLCDGKKDLELMIESSAISASSGNISDSINDVEVEHLCDGKKDSELMIESSAMSASSRNVSDSINDVEVEHLCDGKKDSELMIKSSAISASSGNVSDSINDDQARTRAKKPKMKGLSLIELFTSDQIREHINSLRTGQSKSVDKGPIAMRDPMNDNLCQLCEAENIFFEKPLLICSKCGACVKRNAKYYTTASRTSQYVFCNSCYSKNHGESFTISEVFLNKAELKEHRNNEQTEEPWVQCDYCKGWQHQICALFNGKRNEEEEVEYICPLCYQQEITSGERKPLTQDFVPGAKDLPRTLLSDHIEKQLFKRLQQEREQRAKMMGKSFDEVPGAEGLVIRVLSSVDKKLKVQPEFWEFFKKRNYPSDFPYKSKVIMLFQKIEGVDVCLFCMFVQEFGSECHFPNQRRVYLSYLDSIKYFRPEINTVNGEALRTFVYHEILVGYLDYCKKRGFTSFYLWASPPLKDGDYILYCHPDIQKTPRCDRLREWYLSMIRKATREKVVVGCTNIYDHFFMRTGECKAEVTMAQLPYFDGDYCPGVMEEIIKKEKEKGAKRVRVRKSVRCTDLSETLSGEDMLLMQKLGQTIRPTKKNFIVVHLQHACSHCCEPIVSGKRWTCNQCENFQLCQKCHDEEEKRHKKDKHPTQNEEKHLLYPVEVKDVPSDTRDKDGILDCGFFDTRHAFLKLCQVNHYQFNTLRRAKHSSMMLLYHLHNPRAPAFTRICIICFNEISANKGWHCETCSEYDVCDDCYHQEGKQHFHKLTHCLIQSKEVLKN